MSEMHDMNGWTVHLDDVDDGGPVMGQSLVIRDAAGTVRHVSRTWQTTGNHFAFLLQDYDNLKAENERMSTIIGKLPHTADGVPVVHGMDMFYKDGDRATALPGVMYCQWEKLDEDGNPDYDVCNPSHFYSTRAAAKAARKERS